MKFLLFVFFIIVLANAQTGNPTLIDVFLEAGAKVKGGSYLSQAKEMAKKKVEMEKLIAQASAAVSHMKRPSLKERN